MALITKGFVLLTASVFDDNPDSTIPVGAATNAKRVYDFLVGQANRDADKLRIAQFKELSDYGVDYPAVKARRVNFTYNTFIKLLRDSGERDCDLALFLKEELRYIILKRRLNDLKEP